MPEVCVRAVRIALVLASLAAEEMPVRIYTTADGLARDDVHCIRRDSRGYLWFGTAEGLSIFDGYQFTNSTVAEGLPNRAVSDILETRRGEYWIGTYNGLCRFDPKPPSGKHFISYQITQGVLPNEINRLIQRRDGSIWVGTEGGLFHLRMDGAAISPERVRLVSREGDALRIFSLVEDRQGTLWAASSDGLFAIDSDGNSSRVATSEGLPTTLVFDVLEDAQGRIWVATSNGVCQIVVRDARRRSPVANVYHNNNNRPDRDRFTALFQTRDQRLWAATSDLFEFHPEAFVQGAFVRRVAGRDGSFLGPMAEDENGNLWVGGPGAMKVTRQGFTTFSTSDGLQSLTLDAITLSRDGEVHVITAPHDRLPLHRFDGSKFEAVTPYLPSGFEYAWGEAQIHFQDHAGDWWVPTSNGLLRFAAPAHLGDLAHTRPKKIYTKADGLPNDVVLRLFEDSRGDVWIGLYRGLARWDRKSEQIQAYGAADGLPLTTQQPAILPSPLSIAEDRQGNIWIGFHPNGLARYRRGKFRFYTEADGLPKGQINGLYSDHVGRLWIASSQGGLARIADITAEQPLFATYTAAHGLSSDQLFTLVEDHAGRIYLGTGKGVDRLDPDTGNVRHFTAADGVPPGRVLYSLRDPAGVLWFGSALGLSRYVPQPDHSAPPHSPSIRRVRIAGAGLSISELGETAISGVRLGPSQNNLQIEFGSIHFRSGEVLRYQYRLTGADADWSAPTGQRIVTYAGLLPGSYEFAVRAINGEGLVSTIPATIRFVIVPPLWRRPWAIVIEACLLALAIFAAHRYRLRQLLQVERIRTRLASDLHDDIGSGLSEIAILTEVAVAQPHAAGQIAMRVGDRARQLREGMSDIVWSVDPRQRTLADLVARIRQSVYSMLESNGRRVQFEAPEISSDLPLAPDRARQVLLICREALANIARHACASEVSVRMELDQGVLTVDIRDNGRGFDTQAQHEGMGLRNLRRRAVEAKAELTIESSPGHGTRVHLQVPLR